VDWRNGRADEQQKIVCKKKQVIERLGLIVWKRALGRGERGVRSKRNAVNQSREGGVRYMDAQAKSQLKGGRIVVVSIVWRLLR
jgi:hypothetical protein